MTAAARTVRCALMRGGSSKGAFFLADDLPTDPDARDDLLLRVMGSPDPRQVDGLGGAHPLTSKVAVVSPSDDGTADVDYLFLQVAVDRPEVSTAQTCGNLLAAVGPFAVERGLVEARDARTSVRVRLVNTGALATVTVCTPGGEVSYAGDTEIAGVPGAAAPVLIDVGGSDSPLLPTGRARDTVNGLEVSCVDNGMPSVLVAADALGCTGLEPPEAMEGDDQLVRRVRDLHEAAFHLMGLDGDHTTSTVPKIVLVSPPAAGGTLSTRSFIPRRVHTAIGVLGAASVAAAVRVPGSVAAAVAKPPEVGQPVRVEHPTGFLDVDVTPGADDTEGQKDTDGTGGRPAVSVGSTSVVRTARMIFDGSVHPRP